MGVSVAQYVREAALARAAYDAGRRGEPLFIDPAVLPVAGADPKLVAESAVAAASETVTDSSAVWAQARLVRRRSEQLREEARAQHKKASR
jgi:hypothetical protein